MKELPSIVATKLQLLRGLGSSHIRVGQGRSIAIPLGEVLPTMVGRRKVARGTYEVGSFYGNWIILLPNSEKLIAHDSVEKLKAFSGALRDGLGVVEAVVWESNGSVRLKLSGGEVIFENQEDDEATFQCFLPDTMVIELLQGAWQIST